MLAPIIALQVGFHGGVAWVKVVLATLGNGKWVQPVEKPFNSVGLSQQSVGGCLAALNG